MNTETTTTQPAARRIRMHMLLMLDFDQSDSPLVSRIKTAVRNASDTDLVAAFEASKAGRSINSAIRDTAAAGGATSADVTAIVAALAAEGVY